MNRTSIAWTDYSSNPLKYRNADGQVVWACEKVSPECAHCYADALAKRWDRGEDFNAHEMTKLTPFLDEQELHAMRTYRPVSGKRCFVADMTDLYGAWVPDDFLNRLYSQTLEIRTDVTWQILTKRSDRLKDYLGWRYGPRDEGGMRIPSRHIHHGVSVGTRDALARLDDLAQTISALRFVSFEPLLEDLGDLTPWILAIDWAIVGGESGPKYRRCDAAWMRSIVDQLKDAQIPVFVKQGSGARPGLPTGDPVLDALKEFPRVMVPA